MRKGVRTTSISFCHSDENDLTFFSGNEDGAVYSWNLETGKELGEIEVGSKVYALDFSKAARKTYAVTSGDAV